MKIPGCDVSFVVRASFVVAGEVDGSELPHSFASTVLISPVIPAAV